MNGSSRASRLREDAEAVTPNFADKCRMTQESLAGQVAEGCVRVCFAILSRSLTDKVHGGALKFSTVGDSRGNRDSNKSNVYTSP